MIWIGRDRKGSVREKTEVYIPIREMLHSSQAWPPAGSCPPSEPGPVRTSREHPVPTLPLRQNPPEVSRAPKILYPFPISSWEERWAI